MSLQRLISRLRAFDVEKELLDAVKQNEDIIRDLNTEDQLFSKGIDSRGNQLPLPYAPMTIAIKQQKGQPTNRITLRDEGDFHKGFFVRADKFPIEIDSTDGKRSKLVAEWGEDIFGLTESNLFEAGKTIKSDFQDLQRKALGI